MRILKLILLNVMILSSFAIKAQSLESAIHFDGRYNKSDKAVVTYLKGKKIKDYNLSVFHSIAINESSEDVEKMNNTILNDIKKATQVEQIYSQNTLKACYMQFNPDDKSPDLNRFLLYKSDNDNAVIIYLEGNTSLDQLIKIFINKK